MAVISKAQIRTNIKSMCRALEQDSCKLASYKVLENLKPLLDKANNIVVYHAHGSELNLSSVIDYCLKQHKQLLVPVSYRYTKEMLLTKYDKSCTDIFVPDWFVPSAPSFKWYNLDLVLLPVVAVSKAGVRLGQGGGYYDVTLADVIKRESRPILCGVGYTFQLLSDIPTEEWDISLDYFVSETALNFFEL